MPRAKKQTAEPKAPKAESEPQHIVAVSDRIHKGDGVYWQKGEVISGNPESLAHLVRRGLVRLG